ncbi:DUF6103 family protein [Anaerorhabdus sp.]|uniref:DUF6103 family protein n=1 Tax=Anaerorhabdus sp. TaxID=1872524 RepID=UPI002B1EA1E9|nr:DUF6103 family protein [Anaerorhabdus sp.]MEA4875656.1 DUF6103 family protein [Anaerorhabdus sp.]
MKKVKFIIEIEDEKLNAINLYSKDSEPDLKTVLDSTIQQFYEKTVPHEVRFYLESKINDEKKKPAPSIHKFKKQSDINKPK